MLPDGEKKFDDILAVSTQYWRVTNRQTDRHITTCSIVRTMRTRTSHSSIGMNPHYVR